MQNHDFAMENQYVSWNQYAFSMKAYAFSMCWIRTRAVADMGEEGPWEKLAQGAWQPDATSNALDSEILSINEALRIIFTFFSLVDVL